MVGKFGNEERVLDLINITVTLGPLPGAAAGSPCPKGMLFGVAGKLL